MTATDTDPIVEELGQEEELVKAPSPDDLRLWSVTTILGVLDKPALLYWAAEQTATAAIENQATWSSMLLDRGQDEAVKWLRDARFRSSKLQLSAAALGSVVHAACEEYALSGVRPDLDRLQVLVRNESPKMAAEGVLAEAQSAVAFLDRFDEWLQHFQPEYIATEVSVYHPDYGYAGTADGFLKIDGVPLIVDYKTSRKSVDGQGKTTGPYPEAALQLAAYRYAKWAAVWRPRKFEYYRRRYYLLSPAEQERAVPPPAVEGGLVIHITPEHCHAHPVRCDEAVFEAFLFVQECARWQFELSKTVVGAPMTPGEA